MRARIKRPEVYTAEGRIVQRMSMIVFAAQSHRPSVIGTVLSSLKVLQIVLLRSTVIGTLPAETFCVC